MVSLGLPVSTNIAVPTLKLLLRPFTTETSAAFSVSKAVFQFAVLSMKISTFGRSAAMLGLAGKMAVSPLTGSNTVPPAGIVWPAGAVTVTTEVGLLNGVMLFIVYSIP